MDTKKLGLRERKQILARLALRDALEKRLNTTRYDDIAIKDLCRDAHISEATFFNYFPRKYELFIYAMQLWSVEVAQKARLVWEQENSALNAIQCIFDDIAQQSADQPRITREWLTFQARLDEIPHIAPLSMEEKQLAFPDAERLEELSSEGTNVLLPHYIQLAMKNNELPEDTNIMLLWVALSSIFMGVPMCLLLGAPWSIKSMYHQQLNLMWAGVRAGACRGPA